MPELKYGWKPDLPDHRDHYFKLRMSAAALPTFVDLRPSTPTSFNQFELGSCTANAAGAAIKFGQNKQKLYPTYVPSRLYIYWNTRSLEGTINIDAGATLRNTIKAVAKWGAPSESLWAYDTTKFRIKAPSSVYAEGAKHLVVDYQRVMQDSISTQTCLASGFPFVMGFSVYESFESSAVSTTGMMPMPGPNEAFLGGHAVLCVGYNAGTTVVNGVPPRHFIMHNSWGPYWGVNGRFFMPFDYLLNSDLCADFWKITQIQ